MENSFLFGSHISTSNSIPNAITQIIKHKANFIQIFISNPRNGRFQKVGKNEIYKIKNSLLLNNIKFVIHSPFVLNFSKLFNERNWCLDTLIKELEFADIFDECIGTVLHFKKSSKISLKDAYKNFIESIKYVIDNTTSKSKIIIETSSSEKTGICYKIQDFVELWNMFPDQYKERLGISIDTCHIFAAGHDISTKKKVIDFFKIFDKLIGNKYISLIHFNDSKKKLGSRIDKHDSIGYGHIGLEGLKQIVDFSKDNNIPLVLETPSKKHQNEINLIKSWTYDNKKFLNIINF
jgi:apurinic endonuclease APN1